jgi:hypothetical protein
MSRKTWCLAIFWFLTGSFGPSAVAGPLLPFGFTPSLGLTARVLVKPGMVAAVRARLEMEFYLRPASFYAALEPVLATAELGPGALAALEHELTVLDPGKEGVIEDALPGRHARPRIPRGELKETLVAFHERFPRLERDPEFLAGISENDLEWLRKAAAVRTGKDPLRTDEFYLNVVVSRGALRWLQRWLGVGERVYDLPVAYELGEAARGLEAGNKAAVLPAVNVALRMRSAMRRRWGSVPMGTSETVPFQRLIPWMAADLRCGIGLLTEALENSFPERRGDTEAYVRASAARRLTFPVPKDFTMVTAQHAPLIDEALAALDDALALLDVHDGLAARILRGHGIDNPGQAVAFERGPWTKTQIHVLEDLGLRTPAPSSPVRPGQFQSKPGRLGDLLREYVTSDIEEGHIIVLSSVSAVRGPGENNVVLIEFEDMMLEDTFFLVIQVPGQLGTNPFFFEVEGKGDDGSLRRTNFETLCAGPYRAGLLGDASVFEAARIGGGFRLVLGDGSVARFSLPDAPELRYSVAD